MPAVLSRGMKLFQFESSAKVKKRFEASHTLRYWRASGFSFKQRVVLARMNIPASSSVMG